MPNKLTFEEVKVTVESKGIVLLGKEYVNTLQKLATLPA
jgi:hypothetical protein